MEIGPGEPARAQHRMGKDPARPNVSSAVIAQHSGRAVSPRATHEIEIAVGIHVGGPDAGGPHAREAHGNFAWAVTLTKAPGAACRSRQMPAGPTAARSSLKSAFRSATAAAAIAGQPLAAGTPASPTWKPSARRIEDGRTRVAAEHGVDPVGAAGGVAERLDGERRVSESAGASSGAGFARTTNRVSGRPTSSRGVLTSSSAAR